MGDNGVRHKSTRRFRIYGRTYIEVWSLKAFWKQDVKKPPAKVAKPKKRTA